MNISTNYISNYTFSILKESIQPTLSTKQKVILGVVLAALSFIAAAILYSCCFGVKAKKTPPNVIPVLNPIKAGQNSFIPINNIQNKKNTDYKFIKPNPPVKIDQVFKNDSKIKIPNPYVNKGMSPTFGVKKEELGLEDDDYELQQFLLEQCFSNDIKKTPVGNINTPPKKDAAKDKDPSKAKAEPNVIDPPKKVIKEDLSKSPEVIKVANQIVENLLQDQPSSSWTNFFNSKPQTTNLNDFSFSIYHPKANSAQESLPLLVKFKSGGKESTLPLMTILKAIQWNKLDSKWSKINGKHYHLKGYTGCDYTQMNLFLRQGKIQLNYGMGNQVIDKTAKDQLKACLSASASLKEFPSVHPSIKVKRAVDSTNALYLMNKYEEGNIVTEESFLSTGKGATGFTGDIEYHITLAPHSRGRDVEGISSSPGENECLFFPFTSFKVDKVHFENAYNKAPVDKQILIENPQKLLDKSIKKIIELSEVSAD